MTVTDFLLARIAEDEAAARACEIPSWEIDHNEQPPWVNGLCITAMDSTWDACIAVTDAEHVVRHDPARVLAECAAKRAIIADCRPGTLDDLDAGEDNQPAPLWVARALAAVYKDHPDYQQEWAV